MKIVRFFQFGFLPQSSDLGLLVLRIWLGVSLLVLHGMSKVEGFKRLSTTFADPLHVGHKVSLVLAIFAEAICSILLVLGLCTRFAALCGSILLAVAFFMVHQSHLSGTNSGELAFIYLAGHVVLFLGGGGKFSVDAGLTGKG